MRIHLNPASEALRAFAEGLPGSFDRSGETLHEGRNTIKAFEADGNKLAVKRFQRPDPLRAVIYTFFRRSKARRSYEHAERLRALGIDSPEPVAWSEYRRHGLLCDSYYVCRRSDYAPLSQATNRFPAPDTLPVLEAFARFAAELHAKGIEHEDFNHGNILWQRDLVEHDGSAGPDFSVELRFQREDRDPVRDARRRRDGALRKRHAESLPGRGVPLHPGPLRRGARLERGRHPPAGHFLPARVRPSPRIAQTLPTADLGPPERKNTPKIWIPGIIRYICPSIKRSGRCVHTALHIISITFSFIAREKAGPYAFDPTRRKA